MLCPPTFLRGFPSAILLAGLLSPGAASGSARLDSLSTGDRLQWPRIFKGIDAIGCEWPQVVAILGPGAVCTGVLAHPNVVIYAAHCGGGERAISFGTEATEGEQVVVAQCEANPTYEDAISRDWAYCVLEETVAVPHSPPAFGCELDEIEAGTPVVQVGFGANLGTRDQPQGAGVKRYGTARVLEVSPLEGTMFMGGEGGSSACPGDSGGPALVQLDDGTWRTVGIASVMLGSECGDLNGYAYLPDAVPWIEQRSGFDLTPCFSADGTWNPTEACGGFVAGQNPTGAGQWDSWCADTQHSAPSDACGPAFGSEQDPNTSADDTETGSAVGDGPTGCQCQVAKGARSGPLGSSIFALMLLGVGWDRESRRNRSCA